MKELSTNIKSNKKNTGQGDIHCAKSNNCKTLPPRKPRNSIATSTVIKSNNKKQKGRRNSCSGINISRSGSSHKKIRKRESYVSFLSGDSCRYAVVRNCANNLSLSRPITPKASLTQCYNSDGNDHADTDSNSSAGPIDRNLINIRHSDTPLPLFSSRWRWKIVKESSPSTLKKNVNILWMDTANGVSSVFHHIQPWQCVNHFPGMLHIARKIRLAQHLEFMKKEFPSDYSFFPQTFILPRDFIQFKKEFVKLRSDQPHHVTKKKSKTFIVKPDGGAQGRGIFLTRRLEDIDNLSLCVAQTYVNNPLLIENKKFDLRVYVLVTSCLPSLRLYIFRDGLVRFCTEDFVKPNASNLDDRCMHLTNYAINKYSKKYVRSVPIEQKSVKHGDEDIDEDESSIDASTEQEKDQKQNIDSTCTDNLGSKRKISWFLQWLRKNKGEEETDLLWKGIGDICTKTILSILPNLTREYSETFSVEDEFRKKQAQVLGLNYIARDHQGRYNHGQSQDDKLDGSKKDKESDDCSCKKCHSDPKDKKVDESDCSQSGIKSTSEQNRPSDTVDNINVKSKRKQQTFHTSRCIQILGFDILVDDKLKPHLIEVNHLPSFETDSALDKDVKSRVISQALSIIKAKPYDRTSYEEKRKKESFNRLYQINHQKSQVAEEEKRNGTKERKLIDEIERKLKAVYELYAPDKLEKIPALLAKYKGHEEWLLSQIKKKYKNSCDDSTNSPLPTRDKIVENTKEREESNDKTDNEIEHNLPPVEEIISKHQCNHDEHIDDNDKSETSSRFQRQSQDSTISTSTGGSSTTDVQCDATIIINDGNNEDNCINNGREKVSISSHDQHNEAKQKNEKQSSNCDLQDTKKTSRLSHDNQTNKADYVKNSRDQSFFTYCSSFLDHEEKIQREEERLLTDYERIYPPHSNTKNEKNKTRGDKQPDYRAMESYVYKEDYKQHMRMTYPLHQTRLQISANENQNESVSNNHSFETSWVNNNGNHEAPENYYFSSRADSWIHGNIFISRKNKLSSSSGRQSTSSPNVLPVPSQKQIQAADRLSKGFSVESSHPSNSTSKKPENFNLKNSTVHHHDTNIIRSSRPSHHHHHNAVLVRPVTFDFFGDGTGAREFVLPSPSSLSYGLSSSTRNDFDDYECFLPGGYHSNSYMSHNETISENINIHGNTNKRSTRVDEISSSRGKQKSNNRGKSSRNRKNAKTKENELSIESLSFINFVSAYPQT